MADGTWRPDVELAALEGEPDPERAGLAADDRRFDVPWLEELRRPPANAVWPRLMSLPHVRAVGTLGPQFVAHAEERSGRPFRWWQKLVAYRLLELDGDGRLVWPVLVLTMARQLGKSWLLRELCLWRIEQGERFGEPQDVLHTGKDLNVTKEVQRPGRIWAKSQPWAYKVREVNGQEEIERLGDGSRWMLRAKESVYGYAVSMGAVNEAWKVRASAVDEGLTPTMAEREQAQLLLISTAHRLATKLVPERRAVALAELESGDGDLLIEWSAPADAELDDPAAWRAASPHWTENRRSLIERRLVAMRAGELEDPEEPDPVESFRAQWLNQWPRKISQPSGPTVPLLPEGLWQELREEELETTGPIFVALEDDYGLGAAVAAVARTDDGRLEVDGWLRADWDSAIADLERLAAGRRVRALLVGSSLLDRLPSGAAGQAKGVGPAQTKAGLALLRDLAHSGAIVHDATTVELDQAIALATVKESPSGLYLVAKGPTHLVRAVSWALAAAARPAPVPSIH